MKRLAKNTLFLLSSLLLAVFSSCTCKTDGIIRTQTPERPDGQKDVLELALPPIDTVRVGFIGVGMRGESAVYRYAHIPGVQIKAMCDLHADRVENCQRFLREAGMPDADSYAGSPDAWKAMCERDDINLIYICTDWIDHAEMMVYAMEHGKNVACEVPAAMNLEEIWNVVNTAERTQLHCMMLENCCYDFFEMTTLNMAQQGLFGEVMHVEGAYLHCLDQFWDEYEGNWRMTFNKAHRGDVYPTHGMGPVSQLLNIHRGDRLQYLVSMDTKAVSIPAMLRAKGDSSEVANGDHTMTMIRTVNGKTIQIQHNTATPRPYSRLYECTGTKGYAQKYPVEGFALSKGTVSPDDVPNYQNLNGHRFVDAETKAALMKKYRSPILTDDLEEHAKEVGGHGGMDYIMDYRLVYCLRNGLPLDMDVYDLAEWCSLIPLSALSIENGFAPVEVPDFTRGNWNRVQGFHYAM